MIGTTATKHGRLGLDFIPGHSQISGVQAILRWSKSAALWVAIILVFFLELNAVTYIFFQYRAMPGTNLFGKNYSFATYGSIEQQVNSEIAQLNVPISIQGTTHEFSYDELGLHFSAEKTFSPSQAVGDFWNLPLIQVFTNGSIATPPAFDVDQAKLEATINPLITEVDVTAKDAKIIFPTYINEEISIKEERYGERLNAKIAVNQVLAALQDGNDIIIKPDQITPNVTSAMLEPVVDDAKERISSPITVKANNKEVATIEKPNIARLLTNNGASLAVREARFNSYMSQELAMYFYQAPVTRRINGGVVTEAGTPGVGLNMEAATPVVQAALTNPSVKEITLETSAVEPAEVVDGVYPKTAQGLAALLADFDAEKYGKYNLIVREMRKGGIGASHGGVETIIPASTYKAFIAYAALKSIERGEMTLDTMTPHGTVRDCIYEMIHVSTDHCAISIQDHMGWQKVDDIIHQAGFVNTFINNEGWQAEKYTTALDEYRLFRGYYDGSLLNKEHTAYMIDLFKNQMWRSGIPAGSAPAVVADKVGFYAGRENDVGIVYAPKGDYIIVAMSHGGSFYEIGDLARRIYQFFGN